MKKKLQALTLTKEELLDMLEVIDKTIHAAVLPGIADLTKEVSGSKILADNIVFKSMGGKSDSDIFKTIGKVIEKYAKILPDLKSKIKDNMPDTVTTNTGNLNVKIVLSLLSEGIFFSESVLIILPYLVNKYYTKSGTELETAATRSASSKLLLLVQIVPELQKSNLQPIVDSIGNIPTIHSLRMEESSIIPADVIVGFFKDNFNVSDYYTQTFIKRLVGQFSFKKESRQHDVARNFIGNPIYHIRILMVDMQLLRLESLKEKRRLLDLRLLEMKQQGTGKDTSKVKQQISYYEDRLNKLDLKIEKLMK